jgi:hypothetical protein
VCAWTFRPAGGEGAVLLPSGIRARKISLLSVAEKEEIRHAAKEKGCEIT